MILNGLEKQLDVVKTTFSYISCITILASPHVRHEHELVVVFQVVNFVVHMSVHLCTNIWFIYLNSDCSTLLSGISDFGAPEE